MKTPQQIYETQFKPLYDKEDYNKALSVLLKNRDIRKYLSPIEEGLMKKEFAKNINSELTESENKRLIKFDLEYRN